MADNNKKKGETVLRVPHYRTSPRGNIASIPHQLRLKLVAELGSAMEGALHGTPRAANETMFAQPTSYSAASFAALSNRTQTRLANAAVQAPFRVGIRVEIPEM